MAQPATPYLDRKAVEKAEGWIADLEDRIGSAESLLAVLGGFCADETLPRALIGAMQSSLRETRQQTPALRQALRDLPVREGS